MSDPESIVEVDGLQLSIVNNAGLAIADFVQLSLVGDMLVSVDILQISVVQRRLSRPMINFVST